MKHPSRPLALQQPVFIFSIEQPTLIDRQRAHTFGEERFPLKINLCERLFSTLLYHRRVYDNICIWAHASCRPPRVRPCASGVPPWSRCAWAPRAICIFLSECMHACCDVLPPRLLMFVCEYNRRPAGERRHRYTTPASRMYVCGSPGDRSRLEEIDRGDPNGTEEEYTHTTPHGCTYCSVGAAWTGGLVHCCMIGH